MKSSNLEILEARQLLAGMHDTEIKFLTTGMFLVTSMLFDTAESHPERCKEPKFTKLCASFGYGSDGQLLKTEQLTVSAENTADLTEGKVAADTNPTPAQPESKESKCPVKKFIAQWF